jgi:hypothetical protein
MERLYNWGIFIFNKYIPCSKKLVSLESKRLAQFITENYDFNQYTIILEGIRENLLEHVKNESVKRLDDIANNQRELKVIGDITNHLDESKIILKDG